MCIKFSLYTLITPLRISMKFTKLATVIASASLLMACGSDSDDNAASAESRLLESNAQIAYAVYSDSVTTAKQLQDALATFKEESSAENLIAAKKAWLVSREPYGQSEVYRFREGPIDNETNGTEGDLNAWPLGEALIDYVAVNGSDFDNGQVEVVANSAGINSNGAVDGTISEQNIIQSDVVINSDLFNGNSATNADESDVITGYHAIEFLLWGQDLNTTGNGTNGANRETAVKTGEFDHGGQRPLTDFTTDADAARRHQYLEVVVAKLITDLETVQIQWAPNASHRTDFVDASDSVKTTAKITNILQAMGTLSYGELAGERMQVAYGGNSQEDEHSCFSDNTHRDVWLNAEGVSNSYYGDYAGYDSNQDGIDDVTTNQVTGYGFDDYLKDKGFSNLNGLIETALTDTQTQYTAIDTAARAGEPFDVLIMDAKRDNSNPINTTINALKAQSNGFISAAEELGLGTVAVADTTEAFND